MAAHDRIAPVPLFSLSRALLIQIGLPALVVVLALLIQMQEPKFSFHERIRHMAFDQLQRLHPAAVATDLPIRAIAIDDASIKALGQWPWPRTVVAQMVDRLFELGAAVVVFDIFFAEPDRTSPQQVATLWPEQPELQRLLAQLPSHDQLLATSFNRGRVVLGFPVETIPTSDSLPADKSRFLSFGGDAQSYLPRYGGGLPALPLLSAAAMGSGAVSQIPDSDGVVRTLPLLYRLQEQLYPILGLEALRVFLEQAHLAIHSSRSDAALSEVRGLHGVTIDSAFIPTTPDGRVWLHYRYFDPTRYLSAQALLSGSVDPAQIRDQIILIGATAKGLGDTIYTPLGEAVPGVEGHIQFIEQVLTGDFLAVAVWDTDLLLGVLLLEWLLLALMLARLRPIGSVVLGGVLVAGLLGLAYGLMVQRQLLLDPLYPVLAATLLFLVLVVPRYLQTEREQRWIHTAFSRYVSPNRVKYLQEHPHHLELGGIYRECSFVMSDLQGFTALMERYEPALLSDLLNRYLDGMVQIAFRHEGTLDRIVGDAVAVMFSAPLIQPDHAARALACAQEMDRFALAFSEQQQQQGIPFGRTRIGVNTGRVMVGNFGGQAMLDYRALGDAINTAARLETINAQFGTRVCVSSATLARAPKVEARPIGRLLLKGKSEAITAFELLSEAEAAVAYREEYSAAYAWMEAEAVEAVAAFSRLADHYPEDPLVAYHARRLRAGERGSLMVMKSK